MIRFMYDNDDPDTYLAMTETDEVTLTILFAKFVEFTRMIGYQEGSWHDILKDLHANELNDNYGIFDFATDTIFPIS